MGCGITIECCFIWQQQEKVLEAFDNFLSNDADCEVLMTSRGYAVLDWDGANCDRVGISFCETPEQMLDRLIGIYESELILRITHAQRDSTEEEEAEVLAECGVIRKKCGEK